ncbi:MAG: hypothetical protein IH804_08795 [Planctomycetes bacterium]|nr:hypothetical protein [Planctomycetota bacterium]
MHPHYAIEVKLLGRPNYCDLLAAARQAEKNAGEDQEPIAVLKRKYDRDSEALVIMRLETFRDWRL